MLSTQRLLNIVSENENHANFKTEIFNFRDNNNFNVRSDIHLTRPTLHTTQILGQKYGTWYYKILKKITYLNLKARLRNKYQKTVCAVFLRYIQHKLNTFKYLFLLLLLFIIIIIIIITIIIIVIIIIIIFISLLFLLVIITIIILYDLYVEVLNILVYMYLYYYSFTYLYWYFS